MKNTHLDIALTCVQAYIDRVAIEELLDDNYHFISPIDNALDRAAYMDACPPNCAVTSGFDEIYKVEQDDLAFIFYEARTSTGKHFRNSEVHTVRNGELVTTEVHFGWDLPHGFPEGRMRRTRTMGADEGGESKC